MNALKRGDRIIYTGPDEALLGETGKVIRAGDGHVQLVLDSGDYLGTDATAVSTRVPGDAVARARRICAAPASSQDALRGALRLLLAHIDYEGSDL